MGRQISLEQTPKTPPDNASCEISMPIENCVPVFLLSGYE